MLLARLLSNIQITFFLKSLYTFVKIHGMRKIYSILVFLLVVQLDVSAFGLGSDDPPYDKGLSLDNGSTLITYSLSVGSYQLHEARVEHFFRDRWSLLYSVGYSNGASPTFSADAEGTNEFRAPIGATLGVSALSLTCCASYCGGGAIGDAFSFFALACMIPDGIAYHMPVADRFSISPFVNFSGLSFQWNNHKQDSQALVYSPMAGCRIIFPLSEDFVFMAEQNFRRAAAGNFITSTGASLSVSF